MKKEQRIEMLKKKRKNHKKYSPNKYLNYKIHQMNNRTARNEKGHGCAMRALDTLRKKYSMEKQEIEPTNPTRYNILVGIFFNILSVKSRYNIFNKMYHIH